MTEQPYESIADWRSVISPPSEYAEEAALYVEMIRGATPGPRALGARQRRQQRLAHEARLCHDPRRAADRMRRELSCVLNPECEHVAGDMHDVRLGCAFDAVFVHEAVIYMTTESPARGFGDSLVAHRAANAAPYARDAPIRRCSCGRNRNRDKVSSHLLVLLQLAGPSDHPKRHLCIPPFDRHPDWYDHIRV